MKIVVKTNQRATALGMALLNAASKDDSPASIARQINWRANNTSAGIVREVDCVNITRAGVGERAYERMVK